MIALVPPGYSSENYYNNYITNQQYRDKVPNLTRNTQLAFLFGGLIPRGSVDSSGKKVSFGKTETINPDVNY